jgi:hypothetical protein
MKYFTPELHARTCSANDKVADAAHTEWERAMQRYEKRLARIRPHLTSALRRLVDEIRLHDAQLLYLGTSEDRCCLALQTDAERPTVVSLEYVLAAKPIIESNTLAAGLRTADCLFLYDEVDCMPRNGRTIFNHSILFSNGLHLRLKFSDVAVHIVDPLVQVLPPAAKAALAQTA